MTDTHPQRLATFPKAIGLFNMSKYVPCISISEEPDNKLTLLTITILTLETGVKDTDTILSESQCLTFLNTPNVKQSVPIESDGGILKQNLENLYSNYYVDHDDNLVVKYEDFPGEQKRGIFTATNCYLRIKKKITIPKTFISPPRPPGSKNFCHFLLNLVEPDETENDIVFNIYDTSETNKTTYATGNWSKTCPYLIIRVDKPRTPYSELDFVLLYGNLGYYSNVELVDVDFDSMLTNNFNNIVIDDYVMENIQNMISLYPPPAEPVVSDKKIEE